MEKSDGSLKGLMTKGKGWQPGLPGSPNRFSHKKLPREPFPDK